MNPFATRTVSPMLTVEMAGKTWSVASLRQVCVGDQILCLPPSDGQLVFVHASAASRSCDAGTATQVQTDAFGFRDDAPVIGRLYVREQLDGSAA